MYKPGVEMFLVATVCFAFDAVPHCNGAGGIDRSSEREIQEGKLAWYAETCSALDLLAAKSRLIITVATLSFIFCCCVCRYSYVYKQHPSCRQHTRTYHTRSVLLFDRAV